MTREGLARKLERFKAEPLRPGDHRLKPKGRLLIIGGHEDKEGDRLILRRIASFVGNEKVVVATPATEEPDVSFETYTRAFRALGVRHIHHLHVTERAEADTVRALQVLEDACCVFFTGGDQLKLTSLIGDTPTFSRTFEIFLEGGMLAGTSAGASVMSETMMVSGSSEKSHRIDDNLRLAPGFGFARDMVIDQHFAERGRLNRLLAVVGQNPRIIGIGVDENTAIEVVPNRQFRVIGEGGVTVVDGRTVTFTNVAEAEASRTLSLFGTTLHLLSQGDEFDLHERSPKSHGPDAVEEELGRGSRRDEQAADD